MNPTPDNKTARRVVGVDVGGTFTDLFVLDETSSRVDIVKVPSTRGEESVGFMNGIARVLAADGADSDDASSLATIIHGTTVGTNALIQHRGAPTGLITTDGFRDLIEIGRQKRPDLG